MTLSLCGGGVMSFSCQTQLLSCVEAGLGLLQCVHVLIV